MGAGHFIGLLATLLRGIFRKRLVIAFYFVIFCSGWNLLDHLRLRGLAEGINTSHNSPIQKVENILDWLEHRSEITQGGASASPQSVFQTMQSHVSLSNEVNSSFLFVNLCKASGLKAWRLLLVNPDFSTRHIAAEVFLNEKWAVAEPAYFTLLRDSNGNLLTRAQLQDRKVLQEAAKEMKGYPSTLSFDQAVRVRISKFGTVGRWLRRKLNAFNPRWEDPLYPIIGVLDLRSSMFLAGSILALILALPGSPRLKARFPLFITPRH